MGIRPLVLQGHTRALTRIRVNRDGDLIFTAAKDKEPSVWFTENGERIGTYVGHDGAINDMDISYDSTRLITAGADDHVFLWDVETGKHVNKLKADSVVKSCAFGYSGQIFCYTNMKRSRVAEAALKVCDMRDPAQFQAGSHMKPSDAASYILEATGICSVFSHLDDQVVVGVGPMVLLYDLRKPSEPVDFVKDNREEIRDIQLSADRSCLITASKDRTARMYGARTLQSLDKVFNSPRPINSAAISPTRPHVVVGGGEDAMTVTQTASAGGHFEAKFFHLVYGDEFANIKGHFGPINTLAYFPDGDTFVTGGEDGFVRMNTFDEEFKNFTFDA